MLLKTAKTGRLRSSPLTQSSRYRLPMTVTTIFLCGNGCCYPLCPRCGGCLDREYLKFCNGCGQRLSWLALATAKVRRAVRKKQG